MASSARPPIDPKIRRVSEVEQLMAMSNSILSESGLKIHRGPDLDVDNPDAADSDSWPVFFRPLPESEELRPGRPSPRGRWKSVSGALALGRTSIKCSTAPSMLYTGSGTSFSGWWAASNMLVSQRNGLPSCKRSELISHRGFSGIRSANEPPRQQKDAKDKAGKKTVAESGAVLLLLVVTDLSPPDSGSTRVACTTHLSLYTQSQIHTLSATAHTLAHERPQSMLKRLWVIISWPDSSTPLEDAGLPHVAGPGGIHS
ncbi:hypothetical protein QBC46DRAFT_452097 [Diplogelasinospora grovesii]|uniref:Uncharacterized protein n=1 Tax=Diplogelasinospora grovesii TaxID=303347 RepID=A0AAN6N1W4_9PEZI|nr:hypothetical protein QBC46DRAFT_452097 [Diplogelasinospora grovesii]